MIDDIIELVIDLFFGSIFIAFMSVIFFLLGEHVVAGICFFLGIFLFACSVILFILIIKERKDKNKKWK